MVSVDLPSVLLCGVAAMVLGSLWYSPSGFGKRWMKAVGMTQADAEKACKGGMGCTYIKAFLAVVLQASVLSVVLSWAGVETIEQAIRVAAIVSVGFLMVNDFGAVLWERRATDLFWINAGYDLVNTVLMAAILFHFGA